MQQLHLKSNSFSETVPGRMPNAFVARSFLSDSCRPPETPDVLCYKSPLLFLVLSFLRSFRLQTI